MPNSERGGSSEQHAKAGEQGHKNTSRIGLEGIRSEGSTRGGSHEQHAKAAQQSHKKILTTFRGRRVRPLPNGESGSVARLKRPQGDRSGLATSAPGGSESESHSSAPRRQSAER